MKYAVDDARDLGFQIQTFNKPLTRKYDRRRNSESALSCGSTCRDTYRGRPLYLPTSKSDTLDPSALSLLTSHLTAQATSSIYSIPSTAHLSILLTMLVHPDTTDTPLRRQSSQLLSRVLDVSSPAHARFDQVWSFSRKRKRRDEDRDSDDEMGALGTNGLFAVAEGPWEVIEWAFFKGEGGWCDLLNHIVRLLRNDFENAKARTSPGTSALWLLTIGDIEALKECIFVQWLRDSGSKASFPKAIRAILASPGGDIMLDFPKGIYEPTPTKYTPPTNGDIWGGSIMLSHRIELLTMVCSTLIH
jgi:hypothetical protein